MKKQRIAFIVGVTGQDGCYMSALLSKKKYKIFGFTRSFEKKNLNNLKKINMLSNLNLKKYNEKNLNSILMYIKKQKPEEIYYFAGQSSVGKSFKKPLETYRSNINLLFSILEFVRINKLKTKIYNSCSTDCFGNSRKILKNEKDIFKPISPYGNSKAFAFWLIKFYREKYNLNCKSGILSNHESPLRNHNFVLKRIVHFARNRKKNQKLYLGNISVYRDWGWAPEYAEAIYKINNSKLNKDYVVGTGKIVSLKYIVNQVFKLSKIDKKYLKINHKKSFRPHEIKKIGCDSSLIFKDLNWKPKIRIKKIITKLLSNEIF